MVFNRRRIGTEKHQKSSSCESSVLGLCFFITMNILSRSTVLEVVFQQQVLCRIIKIIAAPPFAFLYSMEESTQPNSTSEVIGHQQYLKLFYSDFKRFPPIVRKFRILDGWIAYVVSNSQSVFSRNFQEYLELHKTHPATTGRSPSSQTNVCMKKLQGKHGGNEYTYYRQYWQSLGIRWYDACDVMVKNLSMMYKSHGALRSEVKAITTARTSVCS